MAYPAATDENILWNALRRGEQAAFSQLMQVYVKRLVNYGHKFSGDQEFIKDCVQELFLELWQYRYRLSATDSVKGYLFVSLRRRIARSNQQNHIFRSATSLDEELPFHVCFDVQTEWIESEMERLQIEQLNQLVNALPNRQKEIIYLKFHQNLSTADMAAVLNIQPQTAANLLHRAIVSLRNSGLTESTLLLLLWLSKQ